MAITVGGQARFIGYTELEEGQSEILTAGELVTVLSIDPEDQSYTVRSVADPTKADNAFPDEVEEIVAEAVAVAVPAPAKPRRNAKAAAAAVTTPVAAPAKGKGKAAAPVTAPAPAAVATLPVGKAKGKGKAAAPVVAVAPPAPQKPKMVVIATIKDMIGTHETALASAKTIAGTLNDLREQEEQTVFSLGGLLVYIRNEAAYKQGGYADMAAYLEAELGMKERSGQYYMRLYTELTDAGVTLAQIEGIGWTKLRSLLGSITSENKTQLLAKAKRMTRDELADHMKEVKAKVGKASEAGPEVQPLTKFPAFKMFPDKAAAFEAAVKAAQKAYDVDNMAEALFYAMNDWMQSQDADVPLEVALETLNAKYGTDYGQNENEGEDEEEEAQAAA